MKALEQNSNNKNQCVIHVFTKLLLQNRRWYLYCSQPSSLPETCLSCTMDCAVGIRMGCFATEQNPVTETMKDFLTKPCNWDDDRFLKFPPTLASQTGPAGARPKPSDAWEPRSATNLKIKGKIWSFTYLAPLAQGSCKYQGIWG